MPHTAGKWTWIVDEYDECKPIKGLADADGNVIFDIDIRPYEQGFEELYFRNEAHAHLIAAAPLLLEAAKSLLDCADFRGGPCVACIDRLRAAIAAAEGEETKS